MKSKITVPARSNTGRKEKNMGTEMPRKVGVRKIWFTGSKQYFERLVWEVNGEYWVMWYYERIKVTNQYGNVSEGWKTVEAY